MLHSLPLVAKVGGSSMAMLAWIMSRRPRYSAIEVPVIEAAVDQSKTDLVDDDVHDASDQTIAIKKTRF